MKHQEVMMLINRTFQAIFVLAGGMVASMGILFADPSMWHGSDAYEHQTDCLSALFIFLAFISQATGIFVFVMKPLIRALLGIKHDL